MTAGGAAQADEDPGDEAAAWDLAGHHHTHLRPPGEPAPLRPELTPPWLRPVLDGIDGLTPERLIAHRVPAPPTARRAAVLIAFAEDPRHGPDVLLVERASTLRNHAGQVAFPGGGRDPGDADAVATALREAEEETGLAPDGVVPLALLPRLHLPPSGFLVTPVVAHWANPVAVRAVDPAETAAVVRVPLTELADPANRVRIRFGAAMAGDGFLVAGLLVWGFTGGLLSALLDLGGWARPWDRSRVLGLEDAWSAARSGRQEDTER
ncbi:NUDIX hydrolase [Pseudonocardia humida]|uniref:CoA pyrophosphatase n=1 Tax=Pseudonocardia humida TaxID=2800819 RepID=A0ABT0ZX73_9PSEU|nr:CoA pyrophosphatase [Pseudonocardia humida]MCO1655350.1 CoA pyrophosphatase [Pseudonocardia humida]